MCHSTILFSLNWENYQIKNPNIKNRDHLVGRPPSKGVSQPKVKSRESSWEGKRKNIKFKFSVVSSGDTRQIFLSRVSTSEYRQPPSIRRVFQTNAHR